MHGSITRGKCCWINRRTSERTRSWHRWRCPDVRIDQGEGTKLSPPRAVHCIENHDEAFVLWREQGFRHRVLVHVDAHHDMWWTSDSTSVTIANFICPALREHIVGELYWVVPDATW